MSWSFQVRNGDLSLSGPGGFAVVTGSQKLIQDLRNWLLEPQGTDPLHLEYGSTLDGGETTDIPDDNRIGGRMSALTLMEVEAEIRRVLTAYQQQQLDRLYSDVAAYDGKNTFAPNEILYSIEQVDVRQLADVVVAKVTILTANGQSVSFTQPLGA